jgi:uncharacterized protein
MPLELKETDKEKIGFFRFKQLNGQYFITNDIGEFAFLTPQEFDLFLSGKIEQACPDKYSELQNKSFIRNRLNFDRLSQKFASKNMFLGQGPSLHIVVVTLRCDHRCIYCQAGSQPLTVKGLDMDIPTAQKVVDVILESPSPTITIEFQGGEPLVNFDAVKFIVEYANKENKRRKKKLIFSLVSNFTFINQARLGFLINNNVGICTSLDGPEIPHNKNRISIGKNSSYHNAIKWLKIINKKIENNKRYRFRVNALTTVTKSSLSFPEEIIGEFVNLGLKGIHLRPVGPFGIDKKTWEKIGFSATEFVNFYRKALDYIIELNLKGKEFYERTAKIFLTKILTDKDPNFLDIRSPCGAGTGQLAYNYNGDVYTCDEARMLVAAGDESFRLGNVFEDNYTKIIGNDILKTICVASCLDGLPSCCECAYKPYCGVCPIYNYVVEGNIFSTNPYNERCKINMGIMDYLFEKMRVPEIKSVFSKWTS